MLPMRPDSSPLAAGTPIEQHLALLTEDSKQVTTIGCRLLCAGMFWILDQI